MAGVSVALRLACLDEGGSKGAGCWRLDVLLVLTKLVIDWRKTCDEKEADTPYSGKDKHAGHAGVGSGRRSLKRHQLLVPCLGLANDPNPVWEFCPALASPSTQHLQQQSHCPVRRAGFRNIPVTAQLTETNDCSNSTVEP
jgi:hypothetical protein